MIDPEEDAPAPGRTNIYGKLGRALKLPAGKLAGLADLKRSQKLPRGKIEECPFMSRSEAFLKDSSLSVDATPEEVEFLKRFRVQNGRRPTALYCLLSGAAKPPGAASFPE